MTTRKESKMDLDYCNIFLPLPSIQNYEVLLEPYAQTIDVAYATVPEDLLFTNNPVWDIEDGSVFLGTTNSVQPQSIYQYQEGQEDEYTLFDANLISPNIMFTNEHDICAEAIATHSQPMSSTLQLQPTVESNEINMIHNNEITTASPPDSLQAPQSNRENKKKEKKQQRKKCSKKNICTNVAPKPKISGGHKDPLWKKNVEDADDEKDKKRIVKAINCHDRRVKEKQTIQNFQLQNKELRKEIKLSIDEERLLEKKTALAHATNGITECAVPPPEMMLISPQAVPSESMEIRPRFESKNILARKDPPLYMAPVTTDTPEKERQRIEKSRRSHEYRQKMKGTAKQLKIEYDELHRSLKDSKTKVGILKKQLAHYQETAAA